MATMGMLLSIGCVFGMLIGMIPFLGWINWFNIPLAFIALFLSGTGMMTAVGPGQRNSGLAGVILSAVAIAFGGLRWALGGFIL